MSKIIAALVASLFAVSAFATEKPAAAAASASASAEAAATAPAPEKKAAKKAHKKAAKKDEAAKMDAAPPATK